MKSVARVGEFAVISPDGDYFSVGRMYSVPTVLHVCRGEEGLLQSRPLRAIEISENVIGRMQPNADGGK
jgi:hypothetical protein